MGVPWRGGKLIPQVTSQVRHWGYMQADTFDDNVSSGMMSGVSWEVFAIIPGVISSDLHRRI